MSLVLHYHPLSSYCWKALIGLYENEVAFEPLLVNFGDEASRNAFYALWPIGKFPVLEDRARGEIVPESSVILDYLDRYHPGPVRFTPADPDLAWRTRLWDRLLDSYIHNPMQDVIADRIRPPGVPRDPHGVAQAKALIARGYGVVEEGLKERIWLSGDEFGLADCAAFPALFYGHKVQPLGDGHPLTGAYLDRLTARPSVQRVLAEAEPFFKYYPAED